MTFRTLLPPTVATFETREDMLDVTLFPSEAHSLGRAVEKRRREFITGRACARAALAHLGFDPVAIATGSYGEPLWPAGIVGSITHCRGYRASAVANVDEHGAIGIDAEVHAPLPAGVLEVVASPHERARLRGAGELQLDRALFSAKESIYKAWFGLTGDRLGFEDADVTLDARDGTFEARLTGLRDLQGSWCVADGVVLTALVIAKETP
jgi:4'-phosphopantetheinyl transferase EntD